MADVFADVIIDISAKALDRVFQYRVPEELRDQVREGCEVFIPFGKGDSKRKGFVVALKDRPDIDISRIKDLSGINERSAGTDASMLELAAWMRRTYGGTMINALQTVRPVREKIRAAVYRSYCRNREADEIRAEIERLNPVRFAGRIRMLSAMLTAGDLPADMVKEKLKVSDQVLKTLEKQGFIKVETGREYRIPSIPKRSDARDDFTLSPAQNAVYEGIKAELSSGTGRTCLLHGITGSGKTEVYMQLIKDTVKSGRQAIVLIPEIALTFGLLMRFYEIFGDRVSVTHSKLSAGEKYDQYERAARGEIDIMIGPRSALFTPFGNTGLIIIDEEHESSYKSGSMPKYHARDVAEHIAGIKGAGVVLGSATPSVTSFYRAKTGIYAYFKLSERYGNARLADVHITDMRKELKEGNRSFLSSELQSAISERLVRGEQTMLFINRRGVAGFVSCRTCGHVERCEHCDVSLTEHKNGMLYCHYCGYSKKKPSVCPECGSKAIAGFKAGTESVEEGIKKMYPSARVVRVDADTVKNKGEGEKLLSAFAEGRADIMVGTQMIVKGHDFPNVTLVGAIAADISLFEADYHSAERTFDLLTQAAGRAGRGNKPGEVFIQTYDPEHYALTTAAAQDYEAFYEKEAAYRRLSGHPPFNKVLLCEFSSEDKDAGMERAKLFSEVLKKEKGITILGPAPALKAKLMDRYRTGLYIKAADRKLLEHIKDLAESLQKECTEKENMMEVNLQFDFDPETGF